MVVGEARRLVRSGQAVWQVCLDTRTGQKALRPKEDENTLRQILLIGEASE